MGSRLEDSQSMSDSACATPGRGGQQAREDDDGEDFVIATTKEFCHGQRSRSTRATTAAREVETVDECCHDDLTLLAQLEPDLAACFSLRLRSIEEQSQEQRSYAEQLRGAVRHAEALRQHQATTRLRETSASRLTALSLGLQVLALVLAGLALVWSVGPVRDSSSEMPDGLCQGRVHEFRTEEQPPIQPLPLVKVAKSEPRPSYGSEECVHRLLQAHAEAQEIEAFMERDILGFQQMLGAMSEWISVASARLDPETELAVGMPCCTSATQAVYQGAMENIRATLVSSNTIAADLRRDLRVERQRILAATSL